MSPSETQSPPSLFAEWNERRRDFFKLFGPAILVTLIGFAIALYFVEPPPPGELVIATGSREGNYYAAATKYAEVFAENGVTLRIRETEGSVHNYQLLLNDPAIHLAIVQGGAAPKDESLEQLESLASLYLEPVWVFHQRGFPLESLGQLQGARVAIGADGSGTQLLARELLAANGVTEEPAEAAGAGAAGATRFITSDNQQTIELLKRGEVDAGFLVLSANSPLVETLLREPQLELMSFSRAAAYSRRYPYLQHVTLEQGVIDLQENLPAEPVQLIAPVANLVVTRELHDAYIPLLLQAATRNHRAGSLLNASGQYPSLAGVEFPVNSVAQHYLEYGPSFFQKYVSFWAASLIDRTKIMLLPLLVLLIPLVRLVPPVYRWRIRSRIYRWYVVLQGVDQVLKNGHAVEQSELEHLKKKVETMEAELDTVAVPLSYMQEFYDLRLHLDLVKRRLQEFTARTGRDDSGAN